MAGVTAYYNQVPRMRELVSNKIISPDGGINPVDIGPVDLPNIRGQVTITIISGNRLFTSMFKIVGGFGDFPSDITQDWYPVTRSEVNCTIRVVQKNLIEVITPVADTGGRIYVFAFQPNQSIGPTVHQRSVHPIGNHTLTVRLTKQNIIQGF